MPPKFFESPPAPITPKEVELASRPSAIAFRDCTIRITDRIAKENRLASIEEGREVAEAAMTFLADMLREMKNKADELDRVPGKDFETLRFMMTEGVLNGRASEDVGSVLQEEHALRADAKEAIDAYLGKLADVELLESRKPSSDPASFERTLAERKAFIKEQMAYWNYAGEA